VEPNVQFFCKLRYDPFRFMERKGIKYGFNMMVHEEMNSIPSLWTTVRSYINARNMTPPRLLVNMFSSKNQGVPPEWQPLVSATAAVGQMKPDDTSGYDPLNGTTYNGAHFWSNFEIADFRFFRSAKYWDFFEYLDSTGNFFYERYDLVAKTGINAR
ncbi:hypothetical protein HK102_005004, partial [Quaeritorhiza haematococci]